MIDQLLLQVANNATPIVTPVIAPVTTAVTPTVVDTIDSLLARSETFITLIIMILSSPGIIALANYFKRGPQRQATEELLGYLALQVKDIRKESKPYTQFVYNILTDEQRKQVEEQFGPVTKTADDKLETLNSELEKLRPKLAPSTRAAMTEA